MSNDQIVTGQVFPRPRNVEGSRFFLVRCGRCGGRCGIRSDPEFKRELESDKDGKTRDDRRVLALMYYLQQLWRCKDCNAPVDIRSEEDELVGMSNKLVGPFRLNEMRLEETREWISQWY